MKTRIILASVIISVLAVYGLMSNPMTARLWIGNITITDTLTGTALFNKGIRVAEDVLAPSGYKFSDANRYIDDDGTDLTYGSGGEHQFYIGANVELAITSLGHLRMPLTTDSLRITDASDSSTVSDSLGYIEVYVNGSKRLIRLYTTVD